MMGMRLKLGLLVAFVIFVATLSGNAQTADPPNWPTPKEGDYVIHTFHFQSGEWLPEVRLHYATLGTPTKDASGKTTNAVLVLHGTGGTGKQF